jgi:hypothetical protein
MIQPLLRRAAMFAAALTVAGSVATVTSAAAASATDAVAATPATSTVGEATRNLPSIPADIGIQAVVYIPGQDVVIRNCKGWMNRRTTDNYVQALGQSWGVGFCEFWLERKRIGAYDWTQVSDTYGVENAGPLSTGFHWNGTDAGSRVCLRYVSTGEQRCSSGYW